MRRRLILAAVCATIPASYLVAGTINVPPGSTLAWPDGGTIQTPDVPPPPPPPSLNLSANPASIAAGDSSALSWVGENVASCIALDDWNGAEPASGNLSVTPARDATYTLSCTGLDGTVVSRQANVQVVQAPPPVPPPPVQTSSTHVDLKFADNSVVSFDRADAVDLGDYNGPFVHQHNYTVFHGPWSVSFRPDVNQNRDEVVVEYETRFDFPKGTAPKLTLGLAPVDIMQPYTATISGGNLAAPVVIPVPNQFGMTRWHWESAPRPVVQTCDDLMTMKAIPKFDPSLKYGATAPLKVKATGPMQTGGLERHMPTTGGRPDIGMVTDWVAAYCMGDKSYEDSWRATAEATGTMPMWVRDAATNALEDLSVHLYPAFNDADHSKFANLIPDVAKQVDAPNRFYLDAAHFPGVAFAAAMMTDSPYYWEAAEAIANYASMQSNLNRIREKLPQLVQVSQPRAWAWGGLRDVPQLAGFMPDPVPTWMLPKSYWQKGMGDNRAYAQKFIDAKATPATTVFKAMPFTNTLNAFMLDYECEAAGWLGSTRLWPEWDAVVDYIATPRLVMSDPANTDGWDHRLQEPYYYPIIDLKLGAAAHGGNANTDYSIAPSSNMPASWAEAFSYYPAWGANNKDEKATFVDPSKWPADGLAKASTYYPTIDAALASLTNATAALSPANAAKARPAYDWLKAQLDKSAGHVSGSQYNLAIAPQ